MGRLDPPKAMGKSVISPVNAEPPIADILESDDVASGEEALATLQSPHIQADAKMLDRRLSPPPVHQRFEWLARDRGEGVRYPMLTVAEGRPSALKDVYNRVVPAYPTVYQLLVAGALATFAFAIWRRQFPPVILFGPFFVNVLLNVYFLYVIGCYLQVLDAILLFGILLAFAPRARIVRLG